MAEDDFRRSLALGRRWEVAVAAWLKSRGWFLMPDYASLNQGGAPSMTSASGSMVLPDLLGADHGSMQWVEVKYRTRVVHFRRLDQLVTGKIEERLWNEYLQVEKKTGIPVHLVFIQRKADEIVGAPLVHIARHCHRGIGEGAGFINIDYECLDRLASLEDVMRFDPGLNAPANDKIERRNTCRACGTSGQWEIIHLPSFLGPLGYCVPCFRREWAAGRTPAWGSEHPARCACAVCFEKKLAANKAAR